MDSQLKPQTVEYFRSLQEILDEQPFLDDADDVDESRQALLENIYEEIAGNEEALFLNRHTSRTLDRVFNSTTDSKLIRLCLWNIREKFYSLACGRCASHPIQALIAHIPLVLHKEAQKESGVMLDDDNDDDDDDNAELNEKLIGVPSMGEIFAGLCEGFVDNLLELCEDPYGSFIARDLLEILCGRGSLDPSKKKKNDKKKKTSILDFSVSAASPLLANLPPGSSETVLKLAEATLGCEDIQWEDLAFHQHAGPVLQSLFDALAVFEHRSAIEKLTANLVLWELSEETGSYTASPSSLNHVNMLVRDPAASHLVQKLIQHASDTVFQALFSHHFRNDLADLAFHPIANFCVQTLFNFLRTAKQLTKSFKKLKSDFDRLFDENRIGVVWQLCRAASNLKEGQENLFQRICKYFNSRRARYAEDDNLVLSLLELRGVPQHFRRRNAYSGGGEDDDGSDAENVVVSRGTQHSQFTWGGAMLIQELLKFDLPVIKELLHSFLSLDPEVVFKLCLDSLGSRVFGAYLEGPGHRSKKTVFINRLSGRYVRLCLNRYGSFCVERCMLAAVPKQKIKIATELSKSISPLSGNRFGRLVFEKFDIQLFSTLNADAAASDKKDKYKKWLDIVFKLEREARAKRNARATHARQGGGGQGGSDKGSGSQGGDNGGDGATSSAKSEPTVETDSSSDTTGDRKRKRHHDSDDDVDESKENVSSELESQPSKKKKKKNRKADKSDVVPSDSQESGEAAASTSDTSASTSDSSTKKKKKKRSKKDAPSEVDSVAKKSKKSRKRDDESPESVADKKERKRRRKAKKAAAAAESGS